MDEKNRLYIVGAARASEPEPLWQYRVYSDRENALVAFGAVAERYPEIWSSISAVTLDDEPEWEFNR